MKRIALLLTAALFAVSFAGAAFAADAPAAAADTTKAMGSMKHGKKHHKGHKKAMKKADDAPKADDAKK